MVDEILSMCDLSKFTELGIRLTKSSERTELYRSILEKGHPLLLEDLWTPEQLDEFCMTRQSLEEALKQTENEEPSAKLLHRLQLLGHCNPALKKPIGNYLKKACV